MSRTESINWLAGLLLAAMTVLPAQAAETVDRVDLDALQGKVVVLDFWASWCVPCRRSFPWLNAMHDKYAAEGLVIIGVNLDNEPADAATFLDEFPPRFGIHFDSGKELAKQFDVIAMPSSYVIGRDGNLLRRHLGFKVKDQDDYEAAIAAALSVQGEGN